MFALPAVCVLVVKKNLIMLQRIGTREHDRGSLHLASSFFLLNHFIDRLLQPVFPWKYMGANQNGHLSKNTQWTYLSARLSEVHTTRLKCF